MEPTFIRDGASPVLSQAQRCGAREFPRLSQNLPILAESGGGVLIRLKAVPGAKRDQIAGLLGDRLKIRVSAPPEGGRANKAICTLLAAALGVKPRDVEIVSGQTNPEKLARVSGVAIEAVRAALGLPAIDA